MYEATTDGRQEHEAALDSPSVAQRLQGSVAASVSESQEALKQWSEFDRRVRCFENWRAEQAAGTRMLARRLRAVVAT